MQSGQSKNRTLLEQIKRKLNSGTTIVEIPGDKTLQKLLHKMLRRDGESIRVSTDTSRQSLVFKRKH